MEVKRAQVSMHCFDSLVGFACDWNFWNAACVLLLVPGVYSACPAQILSYHHLRYILLTRAGGRHVQPSMQLMHL